jgi:DNA polymerase-1
LVNSKPGPALFFDIETHNVGKQWDMTPREFFRLGQYAWGRDGDVILTEDYDEMIEVIRRARLVVGHNIHNFDLSVLFGKDSIEPLQMALDKRVLDTYTWASVTMPAPDFWTDDAGKKQFTVRDGKVQIGVAMKWLGLNNLNTQLGIPTKTADLYDLAKKYQPKGTLKRDTDYGLIPLDDPEFRDYARQDVIAVRELATKLLERPGGVTPYVWREQKFAAICAQNTRNGWLVDVDKATARINTLDAKRREIMDTVVSKYGLPTEGKAPWATADGKAAIFAALADYGITPETRDDWPLTDTGNPSLSGEALTLLTAGTPAEDLGRALAELKGQRPLAQQALDYVQSDQHVHPDITYLQRSGRLSTTKPGLTTWTSRGPGAVEKEYFIARPGYKLVEFDYSNADARVVAAYSGDEEYIKRFEPGVDAHELTGRMVWGDEVYDSDPATYRQQAKMCVHAYSYGARPKTLSFQTGLPIEVTTEFCRAMDEAYSDVVAWQRKASDEGKNGWITNDWGRRMPVSQGRSFTQSSALLGQSGTREILVDGLLRLADIDPLYITYLKAQVHDAIVMELPENELDKLIPLVVECMSTSWKPQAGGQRVEFTLSHGEPADDWYRAGH